MASKASYEELEKKVRELEESLFRQAREQETHKNIELVQFILEDVSEVIWDWHVPSGKIVLTQGLAKMLGYEPDEILIDFRWWRDNIHPNCISGFEEALSAYLESRKNRFELEYKISTKSGEWKWFWACGRCVKWDEHDKPLRFICIHRDITGRKVIQEALESSETRYREMFNNMSSGVAVYEAQENGRDFVIVDFNRAAERITRINKEKVIGKNVLDVFPGVNQFGLFEVFQRVWTSGNAEQHPVTLYQDEKIEAWVENYVYKLPTGELIAVFDDVTHRKRVEEESAFNNTILSTQQETSLDGIIVVDTKGKMISYNQRFVEMWGILRDVIESKSDDPHWRGRGRGNADAQRAFHNQ